MNVYQCFLAYSFCYFSSFRILYVRHGMLHVDGFFWSTEMFCDIRIVQFKT
jgi:hypothetical protein